ncbi:hypothetical protein [Cohnella sp. JJ-181]|uniref:hypothetical protein n=1 Tax=Cohnella rhizoplanae TaxID=2974897 RepID=UPI0022FF85DF|nr:hypothetical protein [Cohnella sp. JJ-181]CAI6017713.1 hypothetical protein COHCIP112018_00176 [Cohnella sp. JJ-181]
MDKTTLEASFDSQEAAEAAVRKLTALRGDRFRMESAAAGADFGAKAGRKEAIESGIASIMLYGAAELEAAEELGTGAAEYNPAASKASAIHLSADIPGESVEQARRVIQDTGGTLA